MAGTLLPTELLLLAVSNVEMLESMFPLAHELEISPSSVGPLGLLRDVSAELESDPAPQATLASLASSLPYDLRLLLHLILDDQPKYPLAIELVLPLRTSPTGSPAVGSLVVRPPAWMSRSSFMSLSETLPPCVQGEVLDNVLALVDHLREEGPRFIPPPTPEPVLGGGVDVEPDENGIDRVWMWLPSLSTKQKRDDITRMAPVWKLTGFVLAGKPGILCLEGNPKAVQEFLGWIKSVSWSDIPSFQKKITERHRSIGIPTRLFDGMQEITNLIDHYGHRGNRGEMGMVRTWIEERGVGADVLGKILNLGPQA